jgi:predicted dinucleotide-binding enzyme
VLVAEKLPGARVVKAFNTILWKRLESEPGLVIFYATDDDAAGDTVAELIREAGFVPVKTGGLRDGGLRQQPGSDIYDVPMNEDEARAILRP